VISTGVMLCLLPYDGVICTFITQHRARHDDKGDSTR